jgi:hypothetical protein
MGKILWLGIRVPDEGLELTAELRAGFESRTDVGTVRNAGRSYGAIYGSLLVSPQEGVQHRQTHACFSGKFFDVGPRDGNGWQLASQTDQCISGGSVGVSRPFLDQGVSSNEEYDGETNCQDNAWYAVHVPFLSEKT